MKRKNKKKNIIYEELAINNSLKCSSFTVNENRLILWKDVLYMRYIEYLGKEKYMDIYYKEIVDKNNNDLEGRYSIKELKTKKTLTITIYYTTGKILIQGTNKKYWIQNEFNKLKEVINMTESNKEMEENYKNVFEIVEIKCGERNYEEHRITIQETRVQENNTEDEAIDNLIDNVLTDAMRMIKNCNKEDEEEKCKDDTKNKDTRIMNSIDKERKKSNRNVKDIGEKLNKVDHFIIKNNKNAVENMETIIMDMQELYNNRIDELERRITEMEINHKKRNIR